MICLRYHKGSPNYDHFNLTDINELLKVNEDDDAADELAVPDSVHGSVVALRHMLRNELVFKNGHYNKTKQKNLSKVSYLFNLFSLI